MTFTVSMVDPGGCMLREIADPRMTRDDVAITYAFGLRQPDDVDWPTVNHAILDRWSPYALRYIKEKAWRIASGKARPSDWVGDRA